MVRKTSDFFTNFLSDVPTKKIRNPKNDTFLFVTNDFDTWISSSNEYIGQGRHLVSPGGVALQCNVTRQAVYNWYVRDRKVTAFVCKPKQGFGADSYILVDLDQARALVSPDSSRSGV